MTYYDDPGPRPEDEPEDAGFVAFQKMQRDIEELKKMVFTHGNVLRDVVNKGQGVTKQVDAMDNHLRTLSEAIGLIRRQLRGVSRSAGQDVRSSEQDGGRAPLPSTPSGLSSSPARRPPSPSGPRPSAASAPDLSEPPPEGLVPVSIRNAEPVDTPTPARSTVQSDTRGRRTK